MMMGLDRAFDLVSDATRLHSFLALRKLDDFFGGVKPKPDDLIAANFGIDVPSTLGEVGDKFLSVEERDNINKGAAHLTKKLTLDPDSEVDLSNILERSTPVLSRLVEALRKSDEKEEATQWLDRVGREIPGGGDAPLPSHGGERSASRVVETIPYAARDLQCCIRLAPRVVDDASIEKHATFMARLQQSHERKHGFWGLMKP
jgi:hypothetical protein